MVDKYTSISSLVQTYENNINYAPPSSSPLHSCHSGTHSHRVLRLDSCFPHSRHWHTAYNCADIIAAREIELRMVTPMRLLLSHAAGLKDIESLSRMDGGTITLSFEPSSDISLLFIEVNEKIDRAINAMPKEMERPKAILSSHRAI